MKETKTKNKQMKSKLVNNVTNKQINKNIYRKHNMEKEIKFRWAGEVALVKRFQRRCW